MRVKNLLAELCFHRDMARTPCEIAHDFGNVMTVIRGSVDLAQGQIDETHPAVRDLSRIARAADEAAALTRELRSIVCDDSNTEWS
jgi:signal transduction histidine kinase